MVKYDFWFCCQSYSSKMTINIKHCINPDLWSIKHCQLSKLSCHEETFRLDAQISRIYDATQRPTTSVNRGINIPEPSIKYPPRTSVINSVPYFRRSNKLRNDIFRIFPLSHESRGGKKNGRRDTKFDGWDSGSSLSVWFKFWPGAGGISDVNSGNRRIAVPDFGEEATSGVLVTKTHCILTQFYKRTVNTSLWILKSNWNSKVDTLQLLPILQ